MNLFAEVRCHEDQHLRSVSRRHWAFEFAYRGPMRAARTFVEDLRHDGVLARVTRIRAELFGSLALTGIGHGTDRAVLLGLAGHQPEDGGYDSHRRTAEFRAREGRELIFHDDQLLPGHPNGMRFTAFAENEELRSEIFYSIGGGFITREGESTSLEAKPLPVPYPFSNGAELLAMADGAHLPIAELMLRNEAALRSRDEVMDGIDGIWAVMDDSIERGLRTEWNFAGRIERETARAAALAEDSGGDGKRPAACDGPGKRVRDGGE